MTVVFAYVPVVHRQVLAFLRAHQDLPIWLLDNEAGKAENVYLERDARALPATEVARELINAHGFTDVTVVAPALLATRAVALEAFIIPEDEIIRFFLERYAPNVPVHAENIFIRWTQKLSTVETVVPADRTITHDAFAQSMMHRLEVEATQSADWWRQIAAAIVKDGTTLAVAHNRHYPSAHALEINGDPRSNFDAGQGPGIYTSIHAEAAALAACARTGAVTAGADVYVTTFPCPTCARSLVEAGVSRVFYCKGYSVLDAESILKDAGVEIVLVQD